MSNNTTKPFYNTTIPSDWEVMELLEISNGKISNGVFNDPKKVGSGYRLINVLDLYNEPNIDASKLSLLSIDSKEFERNKVKCGDVFFTRSSLKLEGIAHCNINLDNREDITFDGHIMKLSPNQEIIYPKYLRLYCISNLARQFFMSRAKQNTMTTIGQDDISDMLIPIPPLSEQCAIAHILSLMDTAINQNNQLIAQKELRKKWLMQNLLTGKKRLKGFGGEWKEIHIRDVSDEVSLRNKEDKQLTVLSCTKYDGLVESLEYWGRKIFADDISTYKIVPKNHFAYATNHIEEGSIGYQDSFDEALISPMYTVFKTDSSINDLYFYKLLKSHMLIYQYQNRMEGSIDRRGGLRWDAFSIIKIHLPSYDEQTAIVQVLQAADKEIQLLKAKTDKLREQKKGMMQVLLTGKKRLKQDLQD